MCSVKPCSYDDVIEYFPFSEGTEYLIAKEDEHILGAYMLLKMNGEIEIHQNLKKEAVSHYRTLGKMVLDHVFNQHWRAVTYIEDTQRTMVNYLLKIGFIYEGRKRKAGYKDGKFYDVHMLGKTKWDL